MINPEDQANETRYQDEENMLLDDKPVEVVERPEYIHPSDEAEKLAKSIFKLYNTAPQYDYYWLIGELGDFERKTLGLKTNEDNMREFCQKNNITRECRVVHLTEEDAERLLSFNPNFFNYTLPHLIRRYITWPIYHLRCKYFDLRTPRKKFTQSEIEEVKTQLRRVEISYAAHAVVFNNTMNYLAKKKLGASHYYADLRQMKATTEKISLKEVQALQKRLFG